jgi:glycosyltransferase involved in cell wall biosynthesis
MKILFVCSGNKPTSVSNLVRSQAESLISSNLSVDMYYIKGTGIFGYIKNILPLKRKIKKNQYNIIHAHYGLSGCVSLIAKNKKSRLIISFMGNDILGDHANNGKSSFYGNLLVRLNKSFAKHADHIIVKSKEMSERITTDNKSIIPNGVNLEKFFPIDRHLALKKVHWDSQLIHIFFLSNPERPEKNYDLVKAASLLLGIESVEMHFLNQIPHNELVNYYNASDVCILTSYHEGSPNVIKEAMACNRPIVSTIVGDVSMVIGDTSGCFVCSYDPLDVVEKLTRAIEFAKDKGSTNGRNQIINTGLDSKTIARKINEIYYKVLKINN